MAQKITSRMKWIIKKMREHGAIIKEDRDAFLEKSHYSLDWKSADNKYYSVTVTERMLEKLESANLVKLTEYNPVYSKGGKNYGKFITSEGVWEIVKNEHSA